MVYKSESYFLEHSISGRTTERIKFKMVTALLTLLLLGAAFAADTEVPACQDDWITFRDELCIKVFIFLQTYEGAKEFCSSQGDQASLVMVKGSELQQTLEYYTEGIFDNIWLGSQYDGQSNQFRWEDGEPLRFSNWQDGYPRNTNNSDSCIEFRPLESKQVVSKGKWADVTCQKRNLVICQKTLSWSFQDAITEIIKLRKEMEEASVKIEEANGKIEESRAKIEEVSSTVVPVGLTYVEYSYQPAPTALWPRFIWADVTNQYAGLFFRAYGGGSAEQWGATQSDCAPRITQVTYSERPQGDYPATVNIPAYGWSSHGKAGALDFNPYQWGLEALQYYTEGCEVRPKNQAIRIWKRIA